MQDMERNHPYIDGERKVISDDKLSFHFKRADVALDIDGSPMIDNHIYFRISRYADRLITDWMINSDEYISQQLSTIWIHEGMFNGRNSYTTMKAYQTRETCTCFLTFDIDNISYHYSTNE